MKETPDTTPSIRELIAKWRQHANDLLQKAVGATTNSNEAIRFARQAGEIIVCADELEAALRDSWGAPVADHPREVRLGVIEFHSPRLNPGLIERFYAVRDDLTAAGAIIDLWIMDIATVLKEFGYDLRVYGSKLPAPPASLAAGREEP